MDLTPNITKTIEHYSHHAKGYDKSAERTMQLRLRTIEKINLKPGDCVLDVACGTGLSFQPILDKIGPTGKLIGIEVSPEMFSLARQRMLDALWKNVTLINEPMETAPIPKGIDAILFNYTHDVVRSTKALENIFNSATTETRVAIAGMKKLPWYLGFMNIYVVMAAKPYMSTLEGLEKPWSHLEKYLDQFTYENTLLGTGYIGSGKIKG